MLNFNALTRANGDEDELIDSGPSPNPWLFIALEGMPFEKSLIGV